MKQNYQTPLAEAVLQSGSVVIPDAALLPFDNGMEVMVEETYIW